MFAEPLRFRDAEVAADLAGEKLIDFPVAWNGSSRAIFGIEVYAVLAVLAQEAAFACLDATDQFLPFHGVLRLNGSRATLHYPTSVRSAHARLASRMEMSIQNIANARRWRVKKRGPP